MSGPPRVVLVGGYGAVGTQIAEILVRDLPSGTVTIAGRAPAKAEGLAARLGRGATALAVDIGRPEGYRPLLEPEHPVALVICCVELPDHSELPAQLLSRGVHYLDLSASFAAHRRLLDLAPTARAHGATAVVGVGLMPGLSNVLATDAAGRLDRTTAVTINLLLGLGEAHGVDAVRWTLRNLGARYELRHPGQVRRVRAFTEPHRTTLLDEARPRRFYRFDFGDQHMLNLSLSGARVDSRMAFDLRAVTRVLAGAARLRLLSLATDRLAPLSARLLQRIPGGTQTFAVQVEAHGVRDGQPARAVLLARGDQEARATAAVAGYLATRLVTEVAPPGVHPIEHVVGATAHDGYAALYRYATDHGIRFQAEPVQSGS